DQCRAIDAANVEVPPTAVKRHSEIGIVPAGHRDDSRHGLVEAVGMQPEMASLATLGRFQHDRAPLPHGSRAEQVIGIAFAGAHVFRRRPLVRRSCAVLGAPAGAKYPAAFFAAISTCASLGTSRSGSATRSTISIPCACTAPCFMFDIDTQRSMRRTPSQWKTSGTSS